MKRLLMAELTTLSVLGLFLFEAPQPTQAGFFSRDCGGNGGHWGRGRSRFSFFRHRDRDCGGLRDNDCDCGGDH
ncbi:MAG: hypothetical protein AB7O26_09110, partial [Planctomycetaceae bacterium]